MEIMAETLHEQREMRREHAQDRESLKQAFNSGFAHVAENITELKDEITEIKGEITEIKTDVRSIDRRLRRFEEEQVLPRLLDLDHRLTVVERKVA